MKTGLTIEAMSREIMRQNSAKADYLLDTRSLEMEAYGSGVALHMLGGDGLDVTEPLDITPIAHRQIGTHLKIPASYYDRMKAENPALLAQNVNSWFNGNPDERMVRTLDGTARAFVSRRYRRIDHLEILQAVLPVLGEMPDARFESCEITESRMYIKVVNPRLETEVVKGDVVQAGVVISNSETGQGSVCVQPLIFRLICLNGMVINDAATRRNHVGRVQQAEENYQLYTDKTLLADDRAFLLKVQDTVRAAVDEARFGMVVDMMQDAAGARMNTNDIPSIVKLAGKNYGLTESEGDGVLNRLIEEHDYTQYGLANAVTRHSQDIGGYDRASDLEIIGYNILSITRPEWNRLNQAASQIAA
jgi:hypothetical protein